MSHWNHRVVKQTIEGEDFFSIREVFYNDDETVYAYTENPTGVCGESIDDIREQISQILKSLDSPVLVDGEVEFVEPEEDDDDEDGWIDL